ncbi:MAG: AAC(3) family N-acetyltransferase [Lachnospiraceae bacterium]
MYTKNDLIRQLQDMGLTGEETILIHSSMKAIGEVYQGADTVLDVWMDFFQKGLLLLPTHTWKTVNEQNPIFNPKETPSCVGLLTNIFMHREGVVRSLHPTHSIAGFGRDANVYLSGEDDVTTPCAPHGVYDRLRERNGMILLVGVGHERNTFIHSIEEVLNVPNRLSSTPMKLDIVMPDGKTKRVYMRKHYNANQPHISEDFVKLTDAYYECGAARKVHFGDAQCILCDAKGVFNVTRKVLQKDPEWFVTSSNVDCNLWREEG